MRDRLKNLLELYGRVGIGVYLVLMALTYVASVALLSFGMESALPDWARAWLPSETGDSWLHNWMPGSLVAYIPSMVGGYFLYKGLQIPRIALALAITPVVARWLGRAPAATTSEAA